MDTIWTTLESPVGPLTVTANGHAITRLFMHEQRHAPTMESVQHTRRDDPWFRDCSAQLRSYFAGELTAFALPLELHGTPFQSSVWTQLREISYGTTITYGQLAKNIANPKAVRAVGLANGKNPIGIIVPCHRVVGSDGSLTGYGGGLERKRWLLQHEQPCETLFQPQ